MKLKSCDKEPFDIFSVRVSNSKIESIDGNTVVASISYKRKITIGSPTSLRATC
ncbi:hypothetical protein WN48_06269 [Eufriesea mexicana]|nr:hypothetical protein WN48_06269 [Eufriesea mexicana]